MVEDAPSTFRTLPNGRASSSPPGLIERIGQQERVCAETPQAETLGSPSSRHGIDPEKNA
jgi:hypothetical protein